MTTKEQARQQAEAHEAAALRNPRKAAEHKLAAFLLRKEFGLNTPISFGRNETMYRVQAFRRAQLLKEQEFKK